MDVSHGETGVRETGWGAWLLVVLTEMSQIRPAVPVWRLLPSERRRLVPEKQGGREREWELTLSPITLIMHQRSFFLFLVPYISFSEWIFLFFSIVQDIKNPFVFKFMRDSSHLSLTLSVFVTFPCSFWCCLHLSVAHWSEGEGGIREKQQEIALWTWIMDEYRASYENKCQCKNSPPLDPPLLSDHLSPSHWGVWGLKATDMLHIPLCMAYFFAEYLKSKARLWESKE